MADNPFCILLFYFSFFISSLQVSVSLWLTQKNVRRVVHTAGVARKWEGSVKPVVLTSFCQALFVEPHGPFVKVRLA